MEALELEDLKNFENLGQSSKSKFWGGPGIWNLLNLLNPGFGAGLGSGIF